MARNKYMEIYNRMAVDKWYTAAELGVAPASMTAMINRGLAEKTDTCPRKYRRMANPQASILDILSGFEFEFFTLYKKDKPIGMLCSLDKERIMDCWGKPYDLTDVNRLVVKKQEFEI
jgi:hypothetical protein